MPRRVRSVIVSVVVVVATASAPAVALGPSVDPSRGGAFADRDQAQGVVAPHRAGSKSIFLVSPEHPQVGTRPKVAGWARGAARQPVRIEMRAKGKPWKTVARTRTNAGGQFSATLPSVTKRGKVRYRAVVPGRRLPKDSVQVVRAIPSTFKLLSKGPKAELFAHNAWGPLVATDDLSTAVYGIVTRDIYKERVESWRLVDTTTGATRELALPIGSLQDISADGRHLLYRTEPTPGRYYGVLTVADLTTGTTRVVDVPAGTKDDTDGAISDDGRRVAFSVELDTELRTERVAVWDAATGESRVSLAPAIGGAHQWGALDVELSSDGRYVAYVGQASYVNAAGDDFVGDIGDYVARWDTSGDTPVLLTKPGNYNVRIAATPSGSAIAFSYWTTTNRKGDGRTGVEVINTATGAVRAVDRRSLRPDDAMIDVAGISGDGSQVLYQLRKRSGQLIEAVLRPTGAGRATSLLAYSGSSWASPAQLSTTGSSALFYGIRSLIRKDRDGQGSDLYLWRRR